MSATEATGKVTPLFAHTCPLQNPDAAANPLRRPPPAGHARGGGTHPRRGQTGQNQPQTALDHARGSSVRVGATSWQIGGARHAVRAPQHPAAHPQPPVWVRFWAQLGGLSVKTGKWPYLGLDGLNRNSEGTFPQCNPQFVWRTPLRTAQSRA